ncbi:hypothetical protein [Synechococcus sp. MIT S9509]
MTRQIEALQEQAAVREEKSHAADVPAWLQARRWMISKGQQKLPTSKSQLIRRLEESIGMRQQLLKELPKVADALGINDDEVQFPEVLLDLLSNAEAEPSVALGRQLLEAGPIDDLVALAPSRATTIRLSVRQWQEDQQPPSVMPTKKHVSRSANQSLHMAIQSFAVALKTRNCANGKCSDRQAFLLARVFKPCQPKDHIEGRVSPELSTGGAGRRIQRARTSRGGAPRRETLPPHFSLWFSCASCVWFF